VEDDEAVQQSNRSLLESFGYKTLIASDGIEAISLYVKYQHDIKVVLVDVIMPNIDGISVVRTLQKINPTVKIIVVSGVASNRDIALAAKATRFLEKPYLLEDLLRSVYDLINDKDLALDE
jgi:CheY-like chemotaxis protein